MREELEVIYKAIDGLENTRKEFLETISVLNKLQPNLKEDDIRLYFLSAN